MTNKSNQVSSGQPAARNLVVLYEDESLLAVNKPAGLPSLPDGYDSSLPHLKSILEPMYGRLWIVHRLDRDTSGLILLARSAAAHRSLNTQFENRQVHKCYHALVCACPPWQEKSTALPLRSNGDRRHRTIVDQHFGKPAVTDFAVLKRLGSYCLLEALPKTGRTHQIRAHLAVLGLPVLGDSLYGGQPALYLSMLKPGFQPGVHSECALIERCALHARSLEFFHPLIGTLMRLEAPYPKDFNAALRMLSRYPGGVQDH